ncbi:MAG: S-methyl-5-thioribose-1-phosphate isomerase [Sulfuriflexus sp.]|nr:S-methyl-5-thioribose-1-phosphate isomerase [Sulfuriflexus sp.]
MQTEQENIQPIVWRNATLELLDQRILPATTKYIKLTTVQSIADAIRDMVVRGAPAIGITAAYGVVTAARQRYVESTSNWKQTIQDDLKILLASRPTAINLFWAINQMQNLINEINGDPTERLLAAAHKIHHDDIRANKTMGKLGAAFIESGSGVLTHCNAGALATGGYGTALGVIRSAWQQEKLSKVFADETRPWLQGARLTAWELLEDNIPVTLVAEGAVSALMSAGSVQWFVVGSDRIAANGDVANKIGTFAGAVQAKYHGIKVMVVAPTSTIDMAVPDGASIPIEHRSGDELLQLSGQMMAAEGSEAWNPVFDVTPASLIDVIVTEKGIIEAPNAAKIAALMQA